MSRTTILILELAIGFVLAESSLSAVSAQLEPRLLAEDAEYRSDDYYLRMTAAQHFFMQKDLPPEAEPEPRFKSVIRKEPKYLCDQPFKRAAKLGSNSYGFVLDSTNLRSRGYDRLLFDQNGNGDLTDDAPIRAEPATHFGGGDYRSRDYPRLTLEIEAGGKKFECPFKISVFSQTTESGDVEHVSARLQTEVCRQGRITLDGKQHRIILLDFNNNGSFNDRFTIDESVKTPDGQFYPSYGDMVILDPDSGTPRYFGFLAADSPDRQYLSKLLGIEGKYYTISVTAAGDRVTIEPAGLPLGSVVNPNGPYRAVLFGEHGFIKIAADKNTPVAVPAGKWRLLECQIDLTNDGKKPASRPTPTQADTGSEKGKKKKSLAERLAAIFGVDDGGSDSAVQFDRPSFTLVSARATDRVEPLTVPRGRTETLTFGPPYKPVVSVGWVHPEKKEARLELKLVGVAGEVCSGLSIKGSQPSQPSFRILNKKGELVRRGKFEYG